METWITLHLKKGNGFTHVVNIHVFVVAYILVLEVSRDNKLMSSRDRDLNGSLAIIEWIGSHEAYILTIPHNTSADLRSFLRTNERVCAK